MNPILKVLISAVLIGIIAEIAKRNTSFAALISALPIVSVLAMVWMYHDTHDTGKIAAFAGSVLWYVLPSLLLFILLPLCLKTWHIAFYPALTVSCGAAVLAFFLLKFILSRFEIRI